MVVVGGTGVGKTTLLNAYVNFLLGVKQTDTFRYIIIDEKALMKDKKKVTQWLKMLHNMKLSLSEQTQL